ncbi:hypothetical protein BdWA1_001914 [Babesia duncani]|uniref:Uncharacterized protein n=1 Tax=Babesia duncani TaxID=323732 RepID=A0AAD9PL30_9APIC|nr:hypothetical protein BdWA1_001914 [Babesia duncani]
MTHSIISQYYRLHVHRVPSCSVQLNVRLKKKNAYCKSPTSKSHCWSYSLNTLLTESVKIQIIDTMDCYSHFLIIPSMRLLSAPLRIRLDSSLNLRHQLGRLRL